MHASTMTRDELFRLQSAVFRFFNKNKHRDVTVDEAARHFVSLGFVLTRPIEDTLEVYGVVERERNQSGRHVYEYPQAQGAWSHEDGWLRSRTPPALDSIGD